MSEPYQEEDGIFFAKDKDQAMNEAMEKARLTLGYFRESLISPRPEQMSFSAKARIQDGEHIEHIWLSGVSFDPEGSFYGTVNNEPVYVTNVKFGSTIGITEESVSDWMIIENGRLIGGYTLRVYRDAMTEEEQAQFDQNLGLQIDEGADYFVHDHSTPEGAILCLEDAYTSKDVEQAMACKDFTHEARHMLARFENMDISDDLVAQTAETLSLSFRAYFTENEMPDFSGFTRAFPRKDYEDEDTVLVTEICQLPDGSRTLDKIWVYRLNNEWRVGPPANEEP